MSAGDWIALSALVLTVVLAVVGGAWALAGKLGALTEAVQGLIAWLNSVDESVKENRESIRSLEGSVDAWRHESQARSKTISERVRAVQAELQNGADG